MSPRSVASRLRSFASALRARWAAASGVELGGRVSIGPACEIALGTDVPRRGRIALGSGTVLSRGAILHPYDGEIRVGCDVHIGPYVVIYGHGGVTIGDDCLVSMHCRILSSNHALPPLERAIRWEPDELRPTKIGRDVWLGAGATVLGGVTLGDGCVVGAGAVVTHDLPPGSIATGVPARVVSHR